MDACILSVTPEKEDQKGDGEYPRKNPMSCAYVFQVW